MGKLRRTMGDGVDGWARVAVRYDAEYVKLRIRVPQYTKPLQ